MFVLFLGLTWNGALPSTLSPELRQNPWWYPYFDSFRKASIQTNKLPLIVKKNAQIQQYQFNFFLSCFHWPCLYFSTLLFQVRVGRFQATSLRKRFLIFCVKSNTVNCVSGSSFMPQGSSGDGCFDGGSRSGSKFSFKLSAGLGLQLLLQTEV